jgi:hypothetical protein
MAEEKTKEEQDLDSFEKLFIKVLNDIKDDKYYRTTYEFVEHLSHFLSDKYKDDSGNFIKYGERIFCYELYHQLRNKIEGKDNDFLGGAKIQGEVKKKHLVEFGSFLQKIPLEYEYTPDFLVHTPGSAGYHAFIIEVKCMPWVDELEIWFDLAKINEFIERYHYQRGIFLSVNASLEHLKNLLMRLADGLNFTRKENKITAKLGNLAKLKDITIISKPNVEDNPSVWDWEQNDWVEQSYQNG